MKPLALFAETFALAAAFCAISCSNYKAEASTDCESSLKPLSQGAETTGMMDASFELSGASLCGRAKRATFLDSQGNAIQTNEESAKINSISKKVKINIAGIPSDFHAIDMRLDELYLGGGDVGGKVIELTGVEKWLCGRGCGEPGFIAGRRRRWRHRRRRACIAAFGDT